MNQFKFDFSMFPRFQGISSSNILIHKSNPCHNLDFWINEDKIHVVSPTIQVHRIKASVNINILQLWEILKPTRSLNFLWFINQTVPA